MRLPNCAEPTVALAVAAMLIASMIGCSDRKEVRYETFAQAKKDRAFERGWLPRMMPSNVSGVRELHDVDTNEGWGLFSFNANGFDSGSLATACTVSASPVTVRSPSTSWWPEYLSGTLTQSQISGNGLVLYECREPNTRMFVALNLRSGTGYFWH